MAYIDPVEASPDNYKLLFENEHVKVLEMVVKAGTSDNEHSHRAETAYFISGGSAKIHLPDGEVMEAEVPDGHVMYSEGWTHRVENVVRKTLKPSSSRPRRAFSAGAATCYQSTSVPDRAMLWAGSSLNPLWTPPTTDF